MKMEPIVSSETSPIRTQTPGNYPKRNKFHIDQMMSKLNTACFVIRTIQAIMSSETLRMVYFAYKHSIISHGIIFWRNQPYSDKIFKIKKRMIRIITTSRSRDSCRELFKNLEILPLYSQYIYTQYQYML